MTDEQIIEVVTARMHGKRIERRAKPDALIWAPMRHGEEWQFSLHDYRVAREPRRVWVFESGVVRADGKRTVTLVASYDPVNTADAVEFVEVMK